MQENHLWIDNAAALDALCARLRGSAWIALDTEFMRERTYYPQLCLVQIATPELVACVDPLALPALTPLLEILHDARILKVLHAARQDLELFFHLDGRVPAPVFDTQIAASFAGFPDQPGYAAVVQGLLGVSLEKSHTRADWSRRPLPEAAVAYAADDVRYLRDVYLRLQRELENRGRLAWVEPKCTALTDPATYRPDPEDAWQRIKGLARLKSRQLGAAKALAAWREHLAMDSNLPRQWVLKDEVLVDLARQLPADADALNHVRGLPEAVARKHGEVLLTLIGQGRGERNHRIEAPERLTPQQEALVDTLTALVRLRSAATGISSAQLATRTELERLVRGGRDGELLHGWRLETVGRELLEMLAGKLVMEVKDGALHIRPTETH